MSENTFPTIWPHVTCPFKSNYSTIVLIPIVLFFVSFFAFEIFSMHNGMENHVSTYSYDHQTGSSLASSIHTSYKVLFPPDRNKGCLIHLPKIASEDHLSIFRMTLVPEKRFLFRHSCAQTRIHTECVIANVRISRGALASLRRIPHELYPTFP